MNLEVSDKNIKSCVEKEAIKYVFIQSDDIRTAKKHHCNQFNAWVKYSSSSIITLIYNFCNS